MLSSRSATSLPLMRVFSVIVASPRKRGRAAVQGVDVDVVELFCCPRLGHVAVRLLHQIQEGWPTELKRFDGMMFLNGLARSAGR